jgi:predicted dehydrogenase
VKPLISHRFAIDEAEKAYELVGGAGPSLGILLSYPGLEVTPAARTVNLGLSPSAPSDMKTGKAIVSFVGSGNYATAVLIPAFKKAGAHLRCVASSAGVSGVHAGRKFGFDETTTDANRLFTDAETHAVVITTQHDSHARFVLQALEGGKHVFVEKPLCLTLAELNDIESAQLATGGRSMVMVGFNRRYAPQVQKMKQLLGGVTGPKAFIMTVNSGAIPADHWTQDPEAGGGRIIGEACHFIDLLRFLAASPIAEWQRMSMDALTRDTVSIQLSFADGSVGTVHYFANGSKAFPKERLEVFAAGRVLQLDNYRKLTGFGWPGFTKMNLWQQDKGQKACAAAFVQAVAKGASAPIPFDQVVEVSRVSIEIAEAAR